MLLLALLISGASDLYVRGKVICAVGKMSERAAPFTLSAVACKFGLSFRAYRAL